MFEKIEELLLDASAVYSEISPVFKIFRIGNALIESQQIVDVLLEVNELLPYLDCSEVPDYGLMLLDSLDVPKKPQYGMELSTASVYLYKAYFYLGKEDVANARICANVVLDVPEWRVLQGKQTLKEIKSYAQRISSFSN